ncbi:MULTISPECIES: hypothetical protein [unclassified Chryseobacterium]|uniref:hypothetical protein n=1 Tax=unclassified Chryseobacterium TaxID=2593645 RepID=UPI00100B185F|nr:MULTISPECIES: hypothetical protein [unclassified Chryseobacterium]RXM53044.1 hypothetical protein BOQ64_01165 [Chryseobacterium sp. CH25]RXM65760.1 hypothetical protein BOQ60_08345 [Chryseobacterium sp. CH1]
MNNYLQIAIDPSCIQATDSAGNPQMTVAVSITGLSFDKINTEKEFYGAKKLLKNFNSHLQYSRIRLYFLDDSADPVLEYRDYAIVGNSAAGLPSKYMEYVKNELDTNIQGKTRLEYSFVGINQDITVDDENFKEYDYENAGQGYSNMAFANFSQMLAPLNEQIGLVFFIEQDVAVPPIPNIPEGATRFLAFPLRDADDPNIKPNPIGSGLWELVYGKTDEVVDTDTISFNNKYISIETEIPDKIVKDGNIHLRDEKGNFDGKVDIEVLQDLDWTTDYYNNIGSYLDFPVLLQDCLGISTSIEHIVADENSFEKNVRAIDGLMWRLVLEPFFPHTKELPDNSGYFEEKIDPLIYEPWVDIIKSNANLVKLTEKLKEILLTDFKDGTTVVKEAHRFCRKIDETTKNVVLSIPEMGPKAEWVGKWIESWAAVIEDCRQFSTPEKKVIIEKLFDETVKFVNDNRLPQPIRSRKYLLEFITQYNQAVYYHQYQISGATSIGKFMSTLETDIVQVWDSIKKDPQCILSFLHKDEMTDDIKNVINDYLKNNVKGLTGKIKKEKAPVYDPPAIQVKIYSDNRIHNDTDDISDEIAGFVLLNQRSKKAHVKEFESKHWHYLNKTKVTFNDTDTGTELLKPLFLPEVDGMPILSLSLTNHKRGIVEPNLRLYNTPQISNAAAGSKTESSPYKMKFECPEFWYGYHYQFAGFVVLNSGVLPPVLRSDSTLNTFKPIPEITDETGLVKNYHHLRKVAIASPNASPKVHEVTGRPLHQEPPSDFMPLAKELSFWKEKECTHLTLSESEKFNHTITFDVSKATTGIWDWFAFERKTLGELLDYKDTDPLLKAVKAFLEKDGSDTKKSDLKLPDPAVSDIILVEWSTAFPQATEAIRFELDSQHKQPFKVCWSDISTGYNKTENTFTVKKGEIIKMKFFSLVDKKYFVKGGSEEMLHESLIPEDRTSNTYENYLMFAPVSYCFEAAKHPSGHLEEKLWDLIKIKNDTIDVPFQNNDYVKVFASAKKFTTDISLEFAYISQLEIRHQRWYWDGRMDVSGEPEYLNNYSSLDPEPSKKYETTQAMKWEAWSFSTRPDHTGTVRQARLKSSDGQINEQLLFSIENKAETKALYHRFAVTAYSRYAFIDKIGPGEHRVIEGKVPIDNTLVKNQWKRFIQLCKREEKLPAPVVRFFIPLTESIKSEHEKAIHQNAAPIMAVVEGNVFNEAGLAYGLEIGIEKLKKDDTEAYLNFGASPNLSHIASAPFSDKNGAGDSDNFIFVPQGPVGFTFDLAAESPKITSSAYLLDLSNENLSDAVHTLKGQHQAWSLMRIATRSVIRKRFYGGNSKVEDLTSKWSEKTWVEYVLAIDSIIPEVWINEVNKYGVVELSGASFKDLSDSNSEYEEQYVVVTKLENDMGGMPVESYYGTYRYDAVNKSLKWDHGEQTLPEGLKGFIRVLIVQKERNLSLDKNIWQLLFNADDAKIQADAQVARPLITKRVPFKFIQ